MRRPAIVLPVPEFPVCDPEVKVFEMAAAGKTKTAGRKYNQMEIYSGGGK